MVLTLPERRTAILRRQGRIWDAAGLRNFYRQGWRHSWLQRLLGFDPRGSTFVTKTTTTDARAGNTALRADLKTAHWRPKSVVMRYLGMHTLNAWGLSGPGAEVVLEELSLMAERGEFARLQISYMPVGDDPADQFRQTKQFVDLLKARLHRFVGTYLLIQLNVSCPNSGHDFGSLRTSIAEHLNILGSELDILIVLKESVDIPFPIMREIVEHPHCSGVVTTNTVKFGNLPESIPWERIYGTESPLKAFGGGGYSGPYLYPLVLKRVAEYRADNYEGFIAAGGGLHRPHQARDLLLAGADAICLGATLVLYRPWRTRAIIAAVQTWKDTWD